MQLKADRARVEWDSARKRREVHIQIGEEVIKRPLPGERLESDDDALRREAVETAKDEGYELDPQDVEIVPSAASGR